MEGAYSQLEAEGYLQAQPKRGFFVSAVEQAPPPAVRSVLMPETPAVSWRLDLGRNQVDTARFPVSTWARLTRQVLSEAPEALLSPVPHQGLAALRQAIADDLRDFKGMAVSPEQIVIAGDSAGGGLALALCLYAKDHALPLPAGIITMSPWTDVTLSGASYEENYTIDPLFGNSKENMLYQCSYIGNADKKDPYLSPLFGNFEGFPPMLMQVGAYEVLLDDTRAAAKKAREEGVKVRCSVYDGMFHVFQMGLDLIPESREAWEEVGEYLRIVYHIRRDQEGKVVKKVKTRRRDTEERAKLNLLAFLKRELKSK